MNTLDFLMLGLLGVIFGLSFVFAIFGQCFVL